MKNLGSSMVCDRTRSKVERRNENTVYSKKLRLTGNHLWADLRFINGVTDGIISYYAAFAGIIWDICHFYLYFVVSGQDMQAKVMKEKKKNEKNYFICCKE